MRVKLLVAGIICLFISATSQAEYDASNLKKLFTNKNQRSQIDATRSGNGSPAALQQTNQVNLSGYVTRSDGKSVVWLNNKNTLDSSRIGDVQVHKNTIGKNKEVTISVDGKTARLKPGESWSKETGKTTDTD